MEDLLSLDDAVVDEVHSIYRPSKRRLPPLLWADGLIVPCNE